MSTAVKMTEGRPLPIHTSKGLSSFRNIKRDTLGWLVDMSRRYEIVHAPVPFRDLVLVNRPDHIDHVLRARARIYGKGTRGYDIMRRVLGNGLVTSEGSFWMRQRRIAQPAFHKKRLDMLGEVMVEATRDMMSGWRSQGVEEVELSQEMMALTLRIVGETLLSVDVTKESARVGDAVTEALAFVSGESRSLPWPEFLPTPSRKRFRRSKAILDEVVLGIIEERRRDGVDRGDLLSMFMAVQDEETGEQMDDAQLRDEVMTMFLAGHETTAMALTWTLILLSRHPTERRRLQAEIDEVLEGRSPGVEDLHRMPFLDRVLKESMRIFPPVPIIARMNTEDDLIDGWHVPTGSYLLISPYVVHRLPDVWENPEGFDPDRFLPERFEAVPKMGYIPFIAGQRKCIGDRFAMMEAALVLATMMQSAALDLVPGQRIVPEPDVTLRPRGGVSMSLRWSPDKVVGLG